MADIGVYTPLKQIVAYTLDELDKSMASFDKCWILAFRCLIDMNFAISGQPITVRIQDNGNKTFSFPSNCLSWSKVGVLNDKGEIVTLKINNALTTFRDLNPDRLGDLTPDINNSIQSLPLVPYYSNFYYGGNYYQLFGLGNGLVTYGEVRVDEKNRVVIAPPDFRFDHIMFECIDVPQKNNDYQVFTCLQEAVIAFIKWKLKAGPKEDYIAAQIIGRRSLPKKKVILQTFNQIIRESESMKLRS